LVICLLAPCFFCFYGCQCCHGFQPIRVHGPKKNLSVIPAALDLEGLKVKDGSFSAKGIFDDPSSRQILPDQLDQQCAIKGPWTASPGKPNSSCNSRGRNPVTVEVKAEYLNSSTGFGGSYQTIEPLRRL
jgi:hypothetical protein